MLPHQLLFLFLFSSICFSSNINPPHCTRDSTCPRTTVHTRDAENATIIVVNEGQEIYLPELELHGNSLVVVNGWLSVGNMILHDSSMLHVQGSLSYLNATNITLNDATMLRVAGSTSQASISNVLGSINSIIIVDKGLLEADLVTGGLVSISGGAIIRNLSSTTLDITANILSITGSPNITANLAVTNRASITGGFVLSSLSVSGNVAVEIDYDNSSIGALYVSDDAQITLSATGSCRLNTIKILDQGRVAVLGGTDWNFSVASVANTAYLGFIEPDIATPTLVTILQGGGNLDFQGNYIAYLGQPSWYIPGYVSSQYTVNEITNSNGSFKMVSNGAVLNKTLANYDVSIPPGRSLAVTTAFNVSSPNFLWSQNSTLQVRDDAVIQAIGDELVLNDLRTLNLQTKSTIPNVAINKLTIFNATLRSELNGVISGDVVVQNGNLDLSFTLGVGTLTIDGNLILTPGSNLTIVNYFNRKRGMQLQVNGNVSLAGNLILKVGGGPPDDYPALGLEAPILTCNGTIRGKFKSISYTLSPALAQNASLYLVYLRAETNALFMHMYPTPRPPPAAPEGGTKNSIPTTTIIGITAGGVVLIIFVIAFLINGWFNSHRNNKKVKPVSIEICATEVRGIVMPTSVQSDAADSSSGSSS